MARGAIHVDCFTALDDIKGKEQGNLLLVLGVIMKNGGRFSVFDATANQRIALTMTAIERSNWVRRNEEKSAYPWVTLELTPEGRAALTSTNPEPRP